MRAFGCALRIQTLYRSKVKREIDIQDPTSYEARGCLCGSCNVSASRLPSELGRQPGRVVCQIASLTPWRPIRGVTSWATGNLASPAIIV